MTQLSAAEWLKLAPPGLAAWLRGIHATNFISDQRRHLFKMQGVYDGAMSDECKRRFASQYAALTDLQSALHPEGPPDDAS